MRPQVVAPPWRSRDWNATFGSCPQLEDWLFRRKRDGRSVKFTLCDRRCCHRRCRHPKSLGTYWWLERWESHERGRGALRLPRRRNGHRLTRWIRQEGQNHTHRTTCSILSRADGIRGPPGRRCCARSRRYHRRCDQHRRGSPVFLQCGAGDFHGQRGRIRYGCVLQRRGADPQHCHVSARLRWTSERRRTGAFPGGQYVHSASTWVGGLSR